MQIMSDRKTFCFKHATLILFKYISYINCMPNDEEINANNSPQQNTSSGLLPIG